MNSAGVGGYFLGGKGPSISLIQRGTVAMAGVNSNTATITSIDTTQSSIRHLGNNLNVGTASASVWYNRVELTNATTVTVTRNSTDATACTVGYAVKTRPTGIIKSVQRGTIALAGVVSATATITSVDLTKSWAGNLGTKDTSADNADQSLMRTELTNATTVTGYRGILGTCTHGYEVEEEN